MLRLRWMLLCLVSVASSAGCEDHCRQTPECTSEGRCFTRGDTCIAHEDSDCAASTSCKTEGLCKAMGKCIAASDKDCAASEACRSEGRCSVGDGACIANRSPSNAWKVDPKDVSARCPCGCDHSEAMAAELRSEGGETALAAIRETLTTIAAREDAGYITEAMVEHRLRMLDVERELAPATTSCSIASSPTKPRGDRDGDRGVPFTRACVSDSAPLAIDGALRVRAELSAAGRTKEIVGGEEKVIRPSFRVGLAVENTTSDAVVVPRPQIEGPLGFPLSRWYVVGGDGRPWDGELGPDETICVNVIGYLAETVDPGTAIGATLTMQSMTLQLATIIPAYWSL